MIIFGIDVPLAEIMFAQVVITFILLVESIIVVMMLLRQMGKAKKLTQALQMKQGVAGEQVAPDVEPSKWKQEEPVRQQNWRREEPVKQEPQQIQPQRRYVPRMRAPEPKVEVFDEPQQVDDPINRHTLTHVEQELEKLRKIIN